MKKYKFLFFNILLLIGCTIYILLLPKNSPNDKKMHTKKNQKTNIYSNSSLDAKEEENYKESQNLKNKYVSNQIEEVKGNPKNFLFPEVSNDSVVSGQQLEKEGSFYKDGEIKDKVRYNKERILVKFFPEFAEKITQGKIRQLPGSIIKKVSKSGFYEIAPRKGESVEELLDRYKTDYSHMIQYAQLDYECEALSESLPTVFNGDLNRLRDSMWHLDAINLREAHMETRGMESVIIALLDTGIAYENYPVPESEKPNIQGDRYVKAPDLENTNFWKNINEVPANFIDDDNNDFIDDVYGWDFINNDKHPNDDNSHGTHLTEIIAQTDRGVAPGCTIMNLKVLDFKGRGYASVVSKAIYYAVENGADVINMSLAWIPGLNPGQIVENAVTYAVKKGVIVIGGSGNNSKPALCYPAAYENVISVGAIDYNKKRAPYSNFGKGLELMAPGGNVIKDLNADGYGDGILQQTFQTRYSCSYNSEILADPVNFSYVFKSGTSIATAQVSGIIGLMLSKRPDLNLQKIRIILYKTSKDLGPKGWDQHYGYGLIDAGAAIKGVSSCDTIGNGSYHGFLQFNYNDYDGDGYINISSGGNDCDDNNLNIYPGAYEIPYDGIDQDCDGLDMKDVDKDGFKALKAGGRDCDDLNPAIFPGAREIANDGIDQDCNGSDLVTSTNVDTNSCHHTDCYDEEEREMECDACCNETECDSCFSDKEIELECL